MLLAGRVSLYFQVLFCIQLGFLACCQLLTWAGVETLATTEADAWMTLAGYGLALAFGAGWQLTRRVGLSLRVLTVLEVTATVLLSFAYAEAALDSDPDGALSGLVLVAMALALRASLIPSPVTRTVLVGVASMLAAAASLALNDVAPLRQLGNAILGTAFVAVTAVTSSVIYGLRREVSAARRLGQYELKRKLGEGGMGVVYEATHVLLGRRTAVKLLPTESSGERNIARFEREVQQTSRLRHPNTVNVYDYGRTPDGQFYYAMEYLDGLNLEEVVAAEGPLAEPRVVHIVKQAAEALGEAHAMSLVHRDVKPANIMLCQRGHVPDLVKVLDFGLVKELAPTSATVTAAGTIVGTPSYLAPEAIAEADAASPASDIYALGAVAYFLRTGRPVFEAPNVIAVCAKHLNETPESPSLHAPHPLDPALEAIIVRCLAKDPADRFETGADLAAALADLTPPETWPSQPVAPRLREPTEHPDSLLAAPLAHA